MREPHRTAAEFDFTPELVVVTYDEPAELPPLSWRWWPKRLRWSGVRRIRRGFVLRSLPLRDLILHQETFALLRRRGVLDLASTAAVLVGPAALYLPRRALREICDLYRRLNELGPAEEPVLAEDPNTASPMLISFDAILRRLERAPFHIARVAALDLTVRQVIARLEEHGEEKIEDLKTQLAMRGIGDA